MEQLSPHITRAVTGQYTLSIKSLFKESWKKTKGVKKTVFAILGWMVLCSMGMSMLLQLQSDLLQSTSLFIIENIISTIILSVLHITSSYIMIRYIAGERIYGSMIFSCDGMFKKIILYIITITPLSLLLCGLFFSILFTPIYLINNYAPSTLLDLAIFFCNFILPIIYALAWIMFTLVYSMSSKLLLEKRLSVSASIKIAYEALSKHWFKNTVTLFSIILFFLASTILTLGIGLIWTIPMTWVFFALWYRDIYGIEAATSN